MKPHLLFFLGTRPEAIKLSPVIRSVKAARAFRVTVCLSGQHHEMAAAMLQHFCITPDVTMKVSRGTGDLCELISASAANLHELLDRRRPDMLIVQGDTTSAMIGAVCGFSERVPIAHVEAGLRSGNFLHPFPEEFNRRVISLAANLHFCPTRISAGNLLKEGVTRRGIKIVGNSGIDALLWTLANCQSKPLFQRRKAGVLVTSHRRENWESGIAQLCHTLKRFARECSNADVLFATHSNPKLRRIVYGILRNADNIRLTDPLDYATFCFAIQQARLIITDSGGIQEEALALGTPTLVTRKVTERPEVLVGGTVQLVGSNFNKLARLSTAICSSEALYQKLHRPRFPFGRGNASAKITRTLRGYFKID